MKRCTQWPRCACILQGYINSTTQECGPKVLAAKAMSPDTDPAFKWWREALHAYAHGTTKPPITQDPEPGFYRRRLVKGGPWVPVAIWYGPAPTDAAGTVLSDAPLLCVVDGKPADPQSVWLWVADNPIPQSVYKHLVTQAKDRQAQGGTARQAINRLTAPIPRFKP